MDGRILYIAFVLTSTCKDENAFFVKVLLEEERKRTEGMPSRKVQKAGKHDRDFGRCATRFLLCQFNPEIFACEPSSLALISRRC